MRDMPFLKQTSLCTLPAHTELGCGAAELYMAAIGEVAAKHPLLGFPVRWRTRL